MEDPSPTTTFSLGMFVTRVARFLRHPRYRLCGIWKGKIYPSFNNGHVELNSVLSVNVHGRGMLSAYLYYEGIHNNEIIYKGLDQLENYSDHSINADSGVWSPLFKNCCHEMVNVQLQDEADRKPRPLQSYSWRCQLSDRWKRMEIQVHKPSDPPSHISFTGDLTKQ